MTTRQGPRISRSQIALRSPAPPGLAETPIRCRRWFWEPLRGAYTACRGPWVARHQLLHTGAALNLLWSVLRSRRPIVDRTTRAYLVDRKC
jgi:hypothetical protein